MTDRNERHRFFAPKMLLPLVSVALLFLPHVLQSGQVLINTEDFEALDVVTQDKVLKALPNLDALLTQAMVNSPDILAAKARITLADSELHSQQLEVARKVFAQRDELKKCLSQLEKMKRDFESQSHWTQTNTDYKGQPLTEDAKAAIKQSTKLLEQQIVEAQVRVDQAKQELQTLVGNGVPSSKNNSMAPGGEKQMPQGPTADKIRTALQGIIEMDFTETPLSDAVAYLAERTHTQFMFQEDALRESGIQQGTTLVTISIRSVPFWGHLQALEDRVRGIQFVVRDYGILVTTPEAAERHGYLPAVRFGKESQAAPAGKAAK